MTERPLADKARLLVKQTTRTVPARVDEMSSVVDIETLEDRPSPGKMELNDLGVVRFRLAEPLVVDPYARNRATGAFILIDESTNDTVGAGMVVEATRDAGAPIPTATLDVIDSRAPRTNQAVIGVLALARRRRPAGGGCSRCSRSARGRAHVRAPLLPAVRRVLRADPAALRRGAARGLPPAARGERRRARRAGGRVGRVRRRAGRPLGAALGLLVAALALLAAVTGFCTGCEAYKLGLPAARPAVRLLPDPWPQRT